MEGIIGLIGGVLFFLSWVLQVWETKKAGKSIVSFNFFLFRLIGSVLLVFESIRVKSIGLTLVNIGVILIVFYNIYIIKIKNKERIY